ncbi:MAG: tripartite tricarboxylate transporter substrate binding protein [Inquilinus sp.]|nr:tripartite tricarboxylate transporter substrate binding protein [Inquilinus sp.]
MIGGLLAGAAVAIMAAGPAQAQSCDWKPERAVTYIVPWGAGGGTDANSRMLASMLEREFGVPFNVVNRTGGNGVVGHTAIATAEPDGYTIGAATVEINMMHWAGLTELTHENISPIALVDIVPASVTVAADSPFDTLQELVDHVKANPGDLTASGTAQGGIWHLAIAGLLNEQGLDPNAVRWIPSDGAASGMQELMAGGVDMVTVALSEAKTLVEAGELKGLAFMHTDRMGALPEVPTTLEALDTEWTLAAFITVSGPEGLPEEIACSYDAAVEKLFQTQEWADFKASRGAEVVYLGVGDLTQMLATSDANLGATMKAIGLAQ